MPINIHRGKLDFHKNIPNYSYVAFFVGGAIDHTITETWRGGDVTEPAFLQMNSEDQQNALRKALGSEFSEAKDYFLFIFQSQDDMETFLSYCVDEQGLKVNAMFLNHQL